jgi:hypothetical protein
MPSSSPKTDKLATLVGIVSGIVSIVSVIISIVIPLKVSVVIIVICLGAVATATGVWALARGWQARSGQRAVVAVGVLVIGAIAIGGGATRLWSASTVAAPPTTADLKFDGQPDRVAACKDFTGTGTVPKGHEIVVFDRSVADTGPYYPDGQASHDDKNKTWVIKEVKLGAKPTTKKPNRDAGLEVDVFARLVTADEARTLNRDNIVIVEADPVEPADAGKPKQPFVGVWKLGELPGKPAGQLRVTRGVEPGYC